MSRSKHRNGSSRPSSPDRHAGLPAAPKPAPPRPRAVFPAAICGALVIVSLITFGGLRSSGFTSYDDTDYVTENAHVRKGLSGESIAWAFTSTDAANWHPLTWLSHMLDVQLFGMDAGRHHLTSLLLHTLNGVLLFLLLFRMTGALWRSAFVAALFVLHPLHVESVAWIAERKDVLSTLFWLLTLGAWLAYVKSKKVAPYALAVAFFALGLMAKPMLVTLPFTLLLLDFWPLQRLVFPLKRHYEALKGLLREKAPFFVLSAASCFVTFVVQRDKGVVATLKNLGFGVRLANAALAYASYLGKTFRPSSLAVFYPHPHVGLFSWAVLGSVMLLVAVTVLAFRSAERAPYFAFGWFWYVGTLVPVIGLVQVGAQGMADRYTYIPLIGIFIAVSWGLAALARAVPRARMAAPAMAVASLAVLIPVTHAQAGHWAGTVTLFEHALEVTSDNYLAHYNVGFYLYSQGRKEEAIAHYREAVRIRPDYWEAHDNLGNALADKGLDAEAIEHYHRALRINPGSSKAWNNLGVSLVGTNQTSEAVDCFQKALKIKPDFAEAGNNLASALKLQNRTSKPMELYLETGPVKPDPAQAMNDAGLSLGRMNRLPEAIERFEQALRINPDYAEAHINLGVALDHENRTPEAIDHFQQALRIKPDSARALDNLGLALGRMNRLPEAISRFQQAVQMDPNFADAHYHLGLVLARTRRFEEAREHLRKALQLNPDSAEARAALEKVQNALQADRRSDGGR